MVAKAPAARPDWPLNGGECGALIGGFDWASTSLGPLAGWPVSLRTTVDLALSSRAEIVLFWGPDFIALYNDAYAPTIGDKHPHALGRPASIYWAELWDDLGPLLRNVFETGETFWAKDRPFKIERHGYLEDVYFDISYSAVRGEDGAVAGVMCIVSETTQRVLAGQRQAAAEAEAREAARQFRLLFEGVPHQVWAARPDGDLYWLNQKVYDTTGRQEGELYGQDWGKIVHPDDLPRALDAWAAARAAGVHYEVEFRLWDAVANDWRWYISRADPVRDDEGGITRWIGTNTDIHAQKLASGELTERAETLERDFDRLWRTSQDLLLVSDADGRFLRANPAWTATLGWTEAELVGRDSVWLQHPEDLERTRDEVSRLAAGQHSIRFENRFRHRDGSWRWLSWMAVPDGDHIYGAARDITAEREQAEALAAAEDALRQSQKMEAVGQLTGGIAHDFNNLLQGIIGSLDLVRKRIAQGRTQELDRFVGGAMASANRAASLTHRLLAFARRQPLDPRPVKANPLIASMEELLRRTMGEKYQLEFVLAAGLWTTLCDPHQLEAAILNLAINARDAMPDGGQLTIETCNTHIDAAYARALGDVRPGRYICVCVTDTGAGMTPDVMERAFDPFFTTKPLGQGTGLGLSMIYGFARQSEGYAKLYSEVGKGTTVKLYLPRHREKAIEDEKENEPLLTQDHIAHDGETVLVIEDDAVVRDLVVEVLDELGYHALEAADGPAGLEILKSRQRIDLLITDIGLPGLNGRQVADAARIERPDLKVLFMTGYAENASLAHGFLEEGMAMVTKPFPMETLATRIRGMIGG